jgi:hypothetical protein
MNARFKQRTPEQMDFEDAGKADYNIGGAGGRVPAMVRFQKSS